VPDEDGDHYTADDPDMRLRDCDDDNPAVHPGAAEIRGNGVDENCDGLAAFDQDGDGWDDKPGPDCDPTKRRVHPRARDKPGNGIDENCDGHDARFPRVRSEVAPLYLALRGRTVGFAQFKVLPVRKGDSVRVDCVGQGCPYSSKTYPVRRSRSELVVGREFASHQMKPGAKVTVKVLRRGHVGRAVRFTLHSGQGKPRVIKRCIAPGQTGPMRRC